MAIVTEKKTLGEFDRVELRYRGELHITQGETPSLEVEADEEVLKRLKTEVKDGVLYLDRASGDWFERLLGELRDLGKGRVRYTLVVRKLRGVAIKGSGTVQLAGLETEQLELDVSGYGHLDLGTLKAERLSLFISGRGEVRAAGEVDEVAISISGSGECQARELACRQASVKISGHGQVEVSVRGALDVRIAGYGSVAYRGEPTVNQRISGGGRVERLP
jgi:hypothetical protein